MLIGYARVSTQEQDTKIQLAALKAAGCEKVFQENASGGRWDRPELHRLLEQLRDGDTLVVWKLDRLSRSLKDLLLLLERIEKANAAFQSLTESIDTSTPAGRMMMQMVGSFAEFEREMLRERTRSGLDEARKSGRVGGRRPKLSLEQQKEAITLVTAGSKSAAETARLFRVHPSTIARLLARHKSERLEVLPSTPTKSLVKRKVSSSKAISKKKTDRKKPTVKRKKKVLDKEILDAVGLARPYDFVDYAFAIKYSTMVEKFYGKEFLDAGKSRGMDYVIAEDFTSVKNAVEMVADFKEAHKDCQEIVVKYAPPGKTILIITAIYGKAEPDHRLNLFTNNQR